jgi:hypothetical protein
MQKYFSMAMDNCLKLLSRWVSYWKRNPEYVFEDHTQICRAIEMAYLFLNFPIFN